MEPEPVLVGSGVEEVEEGVGVELWTSVCSAMVVRDERELHLRVTEACKL